AGAGDHAQQRAHRDEPGAAREDEAPGGGIEERGHDAHRRSSGCCSTPSVCRPCATSACTPTASGTTANTAPRLTGPATGVPYQDGRRAATSTNTNQTTAVRTPSRNPTPRRAVSPAPGSSGS